MSAAFGDLQSVREACGRERPDVPEIAQARATRLSRTSCSSPDAQLVYVLGPEFDEYEGDAVWEDVRLGARHPASFERVAIVTDARRARPATKLFSVLLPGKACAFALGELEAAERWASQA